jgi:hypothetical protein
MLAPQYGICCKCKRPWKFVKPHDTRYIENKSCFPLCQKCWEELKTPKNRLPYYKKLWLKWECWGNNVPWEVIEKAVLNEK